MEPERAGAVARSSEVVPAEEAHETRFLIRLGRERYESVLTRRDDGAAISSGRFRSGG